MRGIGPHPVAAGGFEIAPGTGDLHRPVGRAMIVHDLLLRRAQRFVFVLVHREGEHGRIERRVDVVLHDLVDAEQIERAPGKGDRVGDAALENLARLRRRGLDVRAAEPRHELGDRALRRAHLHPAQVLRHDDLLAGGVQGAGIVNEGEAEMRVLHLRRRVFAIPRVQRRRALARVAEREWHLADGDDRETARLIAGVDISDVGDVVARHVVMIERLAELLGGKDRDLDRAVRRFGDILRPGLGRLGQRVRGRDPEREPEVDLLVLSESGGGDPERGERRRAPGRRRSGERPRGVARIVPASVNLGMSPPKSRVSLLASSRRRWARIVKRAQRHDPPDPAGLRPSCSSRPSCARDWRSARG